MQPSSQTPQRDGSILYDRGKSVCVRVSVRGKSLSGNIHGTVSFYALWNEGGVLIEETRDVFISVGEKRKGCRGS